jgi:hypothetical protein
VCHSAASPRRDAADPTSEPPPPLDGHVRVGYGHLHRFELLGYTSCGGSGKLADALHEMTFR